MPDHLQQHFSIQIQQKLYEKATSTGQLAVYQTSPFGLMLTLDGQIILSESDSFFYHEMMVHPALFTHPLPKKVAITGNGFGILDEVLKHASVSEVHCIVENNPFDEAITQYFSYLQAAKKDKRVYYHLTDAPEWLSQCEAETFDVIIQDQLPADFLATHFRHYYRVLHADGILVKPCQSTLAQPKALKPILQNVKQAGFNDWQTLNFPQPSYSPGWRTIMLASKFPAFKRIREKDVFNRTFDTRYYNFDTHKAALALPEFLRSELEISE